MINKPIYTVKLTHELIIVAWLKSEHRIGLAWDYMVCYYGM